MSNSLANFPTDAVAAKQKWREHYWDLRCRLVAGEKISAEELLRAIADAGRTQEQLMQDVEIGERIAISQKQSAEAKAAAESHQQRRDALDAELGKAIREFEESIAARRKELREEMRAADKFGDLHRSLEASLSNLRARERHLENQVLHGQE